MTARARIAIVIITYNSADVLDACLRSIPGCAPDADVVEVVVADNASTDDTLRIAKESTVSTIPVRIVQVGRNAGYAAGINAGVQALDGTELDAVMVINPDCELRPGSVGVLARTLRRPRCAIAVPKLLNPDGSLQPCLRRDPTVRGALAEALLGGPRAGRAGGSGELVMDQRLHDVAGEVAWATGAAMLVSTAALRELGRWDESFFLYSEETEYMLRARDHGWHIRYEPSAVIDHIGGPCATVPGLAALIVVNKVKLFRRRNPRLRSAAYFVAVLLGQALRAATGRATARASVAALVSASGRQRLPQPGA